MLALFAVGIIAPAVGRALLWRSGPSLEIYFRSDLRMDGLVWGAMLAYLAHHKMLPTGVEVRRYAGLAGFSVLCVFLNMSRFDTLSDGTLYRWGFTLVGFMSAFMICCAITAPDAVFARLLCLRWLRWTVPIR